MHQKGSFRLRVSGGLHPPPALAAQQLTSLPAFFNTGVFHTFTIQSFAEKPNGKWKVIH
jgi:hypothetical protein